MMMNSIFGWLQRKVSDIKVGVVDEEEAQVVYRDELIMTKRQARSPSKGVVKKSVRFADAEATVMGDQLENEKSEIKKSISSSEGEGIRVKVKMTKEEAARLLAKCKEGGLLEFKDVARELVNIPVNRVSVICPTCTNSN